MTNLSFSVRSGRAAAGRLPMRINSAPKIPAQRLARNPTIRAAPARRIDHNGILIVLSERLPNRTHEDSSTTRETRPGKLLRFSPPRFIETSADQWSRLKRADGRGRARVRAAGVRVFLFLNWGTMILAPRGVCGLDDSAEGWKLGQNFCRAARPAAAPVWNK